MGVLEYRVRAEADGYLTMIEVDGGGSGSVLVPSGVVSENWLEAGSTKSIPDAGYSLVAGPPVGPNTVYVLVTRKPLPLSSLGVRSGPGRVASMGPDALQDFARKLRDEAASLPVASIEVKKLHQRIVSRP